MQDTANSYLKTFLGIRFLLYGFDPPDQVRSMLLSRGGIEAQDFTHLVVDNTIYDDPVCVSARNDGKTVVTKLWVHHSFSTGLVVDSTCVIYQPPKDLNGIPGAGHLIICSTGYNRQDRDYIMTMVRLMGAQFSKALVSCKATHLICYKNEGEKYELARRVHQIKIVNHRWLEDCLMTWKLLPEDEYSKSGYEMELMEAEARDSEDDVPDDTSLKLRTSCIVNQSPQVMRTASPVTSDLSKSISEGPTMPVGPDGFLTDHNDEEVLITPATKKKVDTASRFIGLSERTPGSEEAVDEMDYVHTRVERPSHSNMKSSVLSYHRKTPQRSLTSLFVGTSKGLGHSPRAQIEEPINVSFAKVENKKERSCSDSEISERLVTQQVLEGKKLRNDVWKSSPKSLARQAIVTGSQAFSYDGEELKLAWLADTPDNFPDGDHVYSGNGIVTPDGMLNSTSNSSKEVFVTSREKSLVHELSFGGTTTLERTEHQSPDMKLQPSSGGLEELNSPTKHNSVNFGGDKSKLEDYTNHQKGAQSNSRIDLETVKSSVFSPSGTNQRQDDDSLLSTRVRKHTATKKELGSRLKLENVVNKKGSIYLKEVAATKKDLATDPCIGSGGIENETKFLRVIEIDKSLADVAPVDMERVVDLGVDLQASTGFIDDENKPPDETFDQSDLLVKERTEAVGLAAIEKEFQEVHQMDKNSAASEVDHAVEGPQKRDKLISEPGDAKKKSKTQWLPSSKSKRKTVPTDNDKSSDSSKVMRKEEQQAAEDILERKPPASCRPSSKKISKKRTHSTMEAGRENKAVAESGKHVKMSKTTANGGGDQVAPAGKPASAEGGEISNHVEREPMRFMFSGLDRPQRKELQKGIKHIKGKSWVESKEWSYKVTHLVVGDPLPRTEKIFAAAASGRWILKKEYLLACSQEGGFLAEEAYEWHKKGVNEDGSINLESPRKWRLLREKTGHGAFHGMRIVVYGQCIVPPLDVLKRVVKAGNGIILATSPPYTRFLSSGGIDYAIVPQGTPVVDPWVQEFLRHEIPCVTADYLVDYVCRTGYSLDKHVLFHTQKWAHKSWSNLARKAEEMVVPAAAAAAATDDDDVACQVCGGRDRGDVMLLCGDESGNVGCGVGRHIDCCDPPLPTIPQEDWLCPKCSADTNAQ